MQMNFILFDFNNEYAEAMQTSRARLHYNNKGVVTPLLAEDEIRTGRKKNAMHLLAKGASVPVQQGGIPAAMHAENTVHPVLLRAKQRLRQTTVCLY
jgi:hypothetical protein